MSPVQRVGPTARRVLKAPSVLYRWHAGWLLGGRFLQLTHRGRRSGRTYRTVLEVVGRDSAAGEYYVLAGLGERADWLRNIDAAPALAVQVGRRSFVPQHRRVPPEEAAEILDRYERQHRFATPVVRRTMSWLVGWRYDGTPEARLRLVAERPIIGLRPRS